MTYVLELEPEIAQKFEEQAAQNGTTPQEMLLELVRTKVGSPKSPDFRTAADYVLKKNAELLRRLA